MNVEEKLAELEEIVRGITNQNVRDVNPTVIVDEGIVQKPKVILAFLVLFVFAFAFFYLCYGCSSKQVIITTRVQVSWL